MKASSLNELKKELKELEVPQLIEICLRISKYKKENKELLSYLLFEAEKEDEYINKVKTLIDDQFAEAPKVNLYLAYKVLRKIQRTVNKYIRYSGSKQTEIELNLYLLMKVKTSGIRLHQSTALSNMIDQLIKKIRRTTSSMHEDLQYDFTQELEKIIS